MTEIVAATLLTAIAGAGLYYGIKYVRDWYSNCGTSGETATPTIEITDFEAGSIDDDPAYFDTVPTPSAVTPSAAGLGYTPRASTAQTLLSSNLQLPNTLSKILPTSAGTRRTPLPVRSKGRPGRTSQNSTRSDDRFRWIGRQQSQIRSMLTDKADARTPMLTSQADDWYYRLLAVTLELRERGCDIRNAAGEINSNPTLKLDSEYLFSIAAAVTVYGKKSFLDTVFAQGRDKYDSRRLGARDNAEQSLNSVMGSRIGAEGAEMVRKVEDFLKCTAAVEHEAIVDGGTQVNYVS